MVRDTQSPAQVVKKYTRLYNDRGEPSRQLAPS